MTKWRGIFLMGAIMAPAAASAQTVTPDVDQSTDIIVTANKRNERELDVAGAIKAFDGERLLAQGLSSMKDYAQLTPGLQINTALGNGTPIIRGLSTGVDGGTLAAIIVDGAQLGSSATAGASGGSDSLDLDPIDLQRVEVLKGPQGTLYGANTLSGLVSYTLREPDLNEITGVVRGEVGDTEHGGASWSLRGALSVPVVEDKLSVRISGYRNYRGGFVDNSVRANGDQNTGKLWGINGSMLAHPTDRLSIKLTGFYQKMDIARDTVVYNNDGTQRNGDLHYDEILSPLYTSKVRAGIGTIEYDLDFATLTSVTAYQNNRSFNFLNASNGALGATLPVLELFGGPEVPAGSATVITIDQKVKKFSQEIRLTSTDEGSVQWIVGGYYADEKDTSLSSVASTTATGVYIPTLNPAIAFGIPVTYQEYAGFGNLTYKFSDSLDVTGGIRVGGIDQTYQQSFFGSSADALNAFVESLGVSGTPALTSRARAKKTVVNYLATARFYLSRDTMLFARFATGFRPGGPNIAALGLSATYKPDTTQNYEAGLKTKFLDNKGSFDIIGYYTKWKDIIVAVGAGGISGLGNGGDARVYGIESTLTVRPVTGLSLTANLAYSNGKIDKIDAAGAGSTAIGDILPNNPRWSGSMLVDYRFPISDTWQGVVGGNARFASKRHAALQSGIFPDYLMPSYSMFDAHAGLQSDRLDIDLFVRNLTDKRAQLGAYTYYGINEVTVQRPRTYGLAVTARY